VTARTSLCHGHLDGFSEGRRSVLRLAAVGLVVLGWCGVPAGAYAVPGSVGWMAGPTWAVGQGGGVIYPVAALAEAGTVDPSFEQRLRMGSLGILRSIRYVLRRIFRVLLIAVMSWTNLVSKALGFAAVALLVPLLDRKLLASWRGKSFGETRAAALLAVAVYLRLLFDRRTPAIGKVLLGFAIVYGLSPSDLVRDSAVPLGLVDDLFAVILASGCFIRMCPDRVVEENARKATRGWRRVGRRRRLQGDIVDLELGQRRSQG